MMRRETFFDMILIIQLMCTIINLFMKMLSKRLLSSSLMLWGFEFHVFECIFLILCLWFSIWVLCPSFMFDVLVSISCVGFHVFDLMVMVSCFWLVSDCIFLISCVWLNVFDFKFLISCFWFYVSVFFYAFTFCISYLWFFVGIYCF
jgi:hypothetical protein